jgi:hypothetical protein
MNGMFGVSRYCWIFLPPGSMVLPCDRSENGLLNSQFAKILATS